MQIIFLLLTACTNDKLDGDIFNEYANGYIDSTPEVYNVNIHHEGEYLYDGYYMSNTLEASPDIIENFLEKNDKNLSQCAWVYNVVWVLPKSELSLDRVGSIVQGSIDPLAEYAVSEDTLLYYNLREKRDLDNIIYTVACGDCKEPAIELAIDSLTKGQCFSHFKTPSPDYRNAVLSAGERAKY